MTVKVKKLFFMRHAQSMENVHIQNILEGTSHLSRLQLPTGSQIRSLFSFLQLRLDTELSELGRLQVIDSNKYFSDSNFLEKFQIQVIVHSPLQRATLTCKGIQGGFQNVHELECLREATPFEQLFSSTLKSRIQQFERWLYNTEFDRILVVGHSQFFKKMLNSPHLMRNCDVFQCELTIDDKKVVSWSDQSLCLRTPLSTKTRSEYIINTSGDNTDEDPTCRICQMNRSETPTLQMIRPCLCSGSQSHVHIHCLNRWRSTSTTALYTCSVCHYRYRTERTLLAAALLHDNGAIAITILLLLLGVFITGGTIQWLMTWIKCDLAGYLCGKMSLETWWRSKYFQEVYIKQRDGTILQHMIKTCKFHYLSFSDSEGNYHWKSYAIPSILCDGFVAYFVEMSLLGISCMSAIGLVSYFFSKYDALVIRHHHQLAQEQIFMLVLSAISLTMNVRISCIIGMAVAGRELYKVVSVSGRQISQTIGERILEPN